MCANGVIIPNVHSDVLHSETQVLTGVVGQRYDATRPCCICAYRLGNS
jgi:hypothetical protein